MKLIQKFGKRRSLSVDEYLSWMNFNGLNYPFSINQTNPGSRTEEIGSDFMGLADGAYKQNGVVFACMAVRQLLFQEARFQYRRVRSGRPGEYFTGADLAALNSPWENATTGDLLARMIQDVDLAGNWYGVRLGDQIRRLRPDYMHIILGSRVDADHPAEAPDVTVVGYAYEPPSGAPQVYLPEQVAHFAPYPDPQAAFRGMSWLTPVIREVMGDQASTTHKLKFFEQGATPNMVVKFDPSIDQGKVTDWIQLMEDQLGGADNAYRTLYLGGGADATVVGAGMKDLGFKEIQGAGETRIASAAGVPPVIAGFSEGLQAATYSNYSQARRRFADGTMRPLWRNAAGSLATIVKVPSAAELWYDDRDIPFLQEDMKDAAEIQKVNAEAIKGLTEAGYDPQSVVDAVNAGDLSRLVHSGMYSVQLQAPGQGDIQPERMLERSEPRRVEGEAQLRRMIDHFEKVEGEVRDLVKAALTEPVEKCVGRALEALDTLRLENPGEALAAAYEAAHLEASDAIETKSEQSTPERVRKLADSLEKRLGQAVDTAQTNATDAIRSVDEDNLPEKQDQAVTAFVDDADRDWSLSSYASNQIRTLGRRATSRGTIDGVAGGRVQFSEHGSTYPACRAREGKIYPASSAPEPPLHENCQHTLIPLSG